MARVRSVPRMRWSAPSRWRARPSTLVVLLAGLWLFGTGEALLVASRLGNTPWTVLAQGLSRHSPLSIELTVLVAGYLLGGRVGIGTVVFALTIGYAVTAAMRLLLRMGRG